MSDTTEPVVEPVPVIEPAVDTNTEPVEPVVAVEPETKPVEPVVPVVAMGMSDSELQKFVDEAYNEYRALIAPLNITVANFIMLVTKTIEKVSKVKEMNPEQKYDASLMVLNKLVNEIPDTDENDKYYLNNLIPSLINIVQEASQGKLKLKPSRFSKKKQVDVQTIVDDLYDNIKGIIKKNNYGAEYVCTNVVVIVGMIMTGVEQYPALTGMEKKAVVMRVFDNLLDELPLMYPKMGEELKALVAQAKILLPSVIDMLVSVGRKSTNLSFEKCKKMFLCC